MSCALDGQKTTGSAGRSSGRSHAAMADSCDAVPSARPSSVRSEKMPPGSLACVLRVAPACNHVLVDLTCSDNGALSLSKGGYQGPLDKTSLYMRCVFLGSLCACNDINI